MVLQAMSSFSAALASGQLGPLMAQFELGEDVANAATQGGMFQFLLDTGNGKKFYLIEIDIDFADLDFWKKRIICDFNIWERFCLRFLYF